MDVSVENTGGLERRLRVQIPEDRVEGEVKDRLQNMARKVNVPGFRPGKAPVNVVRQRYGRQVREEVVGEIVRTSLQDAITKESLRPAGNPMIDELAAEPGGGVAFEAVFEIYPDVTVPAIEELKVAQPTCEVTEADVDHMVETLRKQRRIWEDVDRDAREGDRATVDFEGRCDGRPIKDGKAESVPVEIGANRMVPGFEEGLVGARAGADLSITATFPDDAPDVSLAGKVAEFDVHVRAVAEPRLPAVDEAFIRSFGVATGDLDSFRKEVRSNLERELRDARRTTVKKRVMDALLEKQALELPKSFVDAEIDRMISQRRVELTNQGVDPDSVSLDRSALETDARRRVALGLTLAEIIKQNELRADPELVRERIESIASTYDESDKVINWYYSNQERLQEIESAVLEDQLVVWILERAQVSDEEVTFDDLLNPGQTNPKDAHE